MLLLCFACLICRSFSQLSLKWSCLFGVLCALDPLQLLYERYVMTEGISLFLRDRPPPAFLIYGPPARDLVFLQVVSVMLIGLG